MTPRNNSSIFVVFLFAFPAASNGLSEEQEKASPSQHAMPALPELRLARIDGFDDDAHYIAAIGRRAAELAESAASQPTPAEQASRLLAAANLVLAEQVEPLLTARFLGITSSAMMSTNDVQAVFERADGWLSQAEPVIEKAPAGIDEPKGKAPGTPAREELSRRLRTLRALSQGLRAYLTSSGQTEDARALRRAQSALSIVLEDANTQVAAAAKFWIACLQDREQGAGAKSAVEVAPLESAEIQPYTFFHRLLRVRQYADRGGHVMALATLIGLHERAEQGFVNAQKPDAIRTIALVRFSVLADWYNHLDPATQADERDWCADQAERLVAENFKDDRSGLLRIKPAIPIIAAGPEPDMPTATDAAPPQEKKPPKE